MFVICEVSAELEGDVSSCCDGSLVESLRIDQRVIPVI